MVKVEYLWQDFLSGFSWLAKKSLGVLAWLFPRLWESIPDYSPFYILAALVIYAGFKGRRYTIVISPFHLPSGNTLPFGEYTVANVLRDTFIAVRNEAQAGLRNISNQVIGVAEPPDSASVLRPKGIMSPKLTDFEVPTRFAIELKGLSHEALVSLARKVQGKERVISGDILLDGKDFCLMARSSEAGPWSTDLCPATIDGLKRGCRQLVLKMLESLYPNLLAEHELTHDQAESAYQRLHSMIAKPEASQSVKQTFELAAVVASAQLSTGGRIQDALRILEDASRLLPESSLLAYNIGVTWQMSSIPGALDHAIANYERALILRPEFPEALGNRGIALAAKGDLNGAIVDFRKAITFLPDSPEAYNNLGTAYSKNGQYDNAIPAFEKALALKHDSPHKVHSNLGAALAKKGRHEEAIAALQKALDLKPDYPEALNNLGLAFTELGVTLTQKGQDEEALVALRKALAYLPNDAEAHYNLGLILRRLGQQEESRQEFSVAQRLNPNLVPPPA